MEERGSSCRGTGLHLETLRLDELHEAQSLSDLEGGELGRVGAKPGRLDIAEMRQWRGATQADQQGIELEGVRRVVKCADLLTVLFEERRVHSIESPQAKARDITRRIGEAPRGEYPPLLVVPPRFPPQDPGRSYVGDTQRSELAILTRSPYQDAPRGQGNRPKGHLNSQIYA